MVSRAPNGAAFSGPTAVLLQLREIMAQKKFLVTGSTGDTGGYTVEQLVERGHAVRALAHREDDRPKRLEKMGASGYRRFSEVQQLRAAVERQLNAPIP